MRILPGIETVTYILYLETDLNRVFTGSLSSVAGAELRLVADATAPDGVGPITARTMGRAQTLVFDSSLPSAVSHSR